MTKSRVIRVFSFIMALTLVFAMCSSASYAISPRQFGAWIASALTALNIVGQSTIGPVLQFGNQMNDYLSAPFKIEGQQMINVPYTWTDSEIEEYLKQSTISFTGDYIEIDGKHYQDVWLSNEASEKFRVNAFDIKSAFDIASNSNGTYVSGDGMLNNTPIFNVNGVLRTQNNSIPAITGIYDTGLSQFNVLPYYQDGSYYKYLYKAYNTSIYSNGYYRITRDWPLLIYNALENGRINIYGKWNGDSSSIYNRIASYSYDSSEYDDTPFDFDWVAGTIPADQQLAPNEGMHLYVPTDPTEWTDNPGVQQIINNYNTYLQNNPDISPDVDLDLNTDGLLDKIGDLLDILGPIIDLMKPSFGPKSEDPDPPVPPVPGDTISNTPWSSLVEWLQRILNKLDDILGIRDILSNFKSAFDTAISTIENILSSIKSVLDSILNAIQNIADSIVNGNADWFSDIVDAIKQPFMPWLNIFKQGVSIWHYVVEWWSYISTAFFFFFGVLNETNYMFIIPFYAVAAACIVIAIYRRFGR